VLLAAVAIGLVALTIWPWLLSLVALGFAAFGAFCLFQSRYRKV
jgi:hypothetical protein